MLDTSYFGVVPKRSFNTEVVVPSMNEMKAGEIFAEASQLRRPEREAYLDRACGTDVALRREVDKLLREFDETVELIGAGCDGQSPGSSRKKETLAAGDCVGRFLVISLIGKGGFGEVYQAEDLHFGGRIALKTLRPEFVTRKDFAARFLREIQLARKVAHPNVCRIYDVGRDRIRGTDIAYFTMELLTGETLAQRLQPGRLSPGEALPILQQIVEGLAALHQVHVTHRDLKPANVMLVSPVEGLRVVITDFGLAHGIAGEPGSDSVTMAGQVLGTPAYMAPEQLTGKKVGPEADIYSLGILMYEMLGGRRPFDANQFVESATQKLSRAPEPPSRYAPLDPRWDSLILSCLERDPEKRPRTAKRVLELLQGMDTPSRGRRFPLPPGRMLPSPRVRRAVIYTGLAAAFAAAVPLQLPGLKAPILRSICEQFPGHAAWCELPPDKDMAVFPFSIKAVAADDRVLAAGTARYIRESFERLAPRPESLCVHLRNDRLAEGVRLVLEGEVEVTGDALTFRGTLREAAGTQGTAPPLVLRHIDIRLPRTKAKELHSELLLGIARTLEIDYPEREWIGWSRAAPSRSESLIAHLMGLGHLEQGHYNEAAQAFAGVIDPTKDFAFAPAHVGLGDAYRMLRNKTGDNSWGIRARQAYQRAVTLDRDFGFAGAEKRWGELEAALGNTDSAIDHLSAGLRLWPYDQLLGKALAAAYEAAAQPAIAEKVYLEAVQRAPECWLTHNALADFYSRHTFVQEAERALLEVVRLAHGNAGAYHNLAFNYIRMGRFDDAIEMASRSIALRPVPLRYSTLGRAFLYRGCPSAALLNLRKAVALDPEYYVLWANLAEGMHAVQPGSDAVKEIFYRTDERSRAALEKNPDNAYARAQYALNLARLGQSKSAMREAERAVLLAPGSHDVLLLAVEALETAGLRRRALAQLKQALEKGLSPHQTESSLALNSLRRDSAYKTILQELHLNPAADPGGLTPSPAKPCPESQVPGTGLGGV